MSRFANALANAREGGREGREGGRGGREGGEGGREREGGREQVYSRGKHNSLHRSLYATTKMLEKVSPEEVDAFQAYTSRKTWTTTSPLVLTLSSTVLQKIPLGAASRCHVFPCSVSHWGVWGVPAS